MPTNFSHYLEDSDSCKYLLDNEGLGCRALEWPVLLFEDLCMHEAFCLPCSRRQTVWDLSHWRVQGAYGDRQPFHLLAAPHVKEQIGEGKADCYRQTRDTKLLTLKLSVAALST